MRNRVFRSLAAILSMIVLTGVPAQAGPIVINQVIQVLSSPQISAQLRLRNDSQTSHPVASGIKGSVQQSRSDSSQKTGGASTGGTGVSSSDALLSGIVIDSNPQTVNVIDPGDVEGTVCDCGEIPVAGGGFPWWPFLFLAGVPLFFIHDCEDCDELPPSIGTPTPPVVPNPNSFPPVPEPASLLLFGTGLAAFGAGLRRRYAKGKLKAAIKATEEG